MKVSRIIKVINNPKRVIEYFLVKMARVFPDRMYLKMLFPLRTGYRLNLDNPKTYNEKLQWLKLNNRNPKMVSMVDKVEAKDYVARIIGDEYIIPTLGVYDSVDDIDFDDLPNQFVLKCTHDSGGIVICSDKKTLDIDSAKTLLRRGLQQNYYFQNREWPYKQVKPRIIAEQYMVDESGYELKDYKFFCFDGDVKLLFVASDRSSKTEETKFDFFDMNFQHLNFKNGHPNATKPISRPRGFEAMKEIAAKLSQGQPHLRVDLYDIDGKIYFGELTFYHWSGMTPFEPIDWDYKLGEMIRL